MRSLPPVKRAALEALASRCKLVNAMNSACTPQLNLGLTRRRLLQVGGLGMFGLSLPKLFAAEAKAAKNPPARAKSVVFLFQWGGPSHLETFDMKPDAPEGIRGLHKPMASSADGIQVNSLLPRTAKVMDKGHVDPKHMISSTVPLEDIQQAFERLRGSHNEVKVHVTMEGAA